MHECHFRSGLDRFVWLFGMAFALHLKDFQSWCERLDALPMARRLPVLAGITLVVSIVWGAWMVFLMATTPSFRSHHSY
jgi:hypothetical protein